MDMVDPQPTLVELLVRHALLLRELLPQIEINSNGPCGHGDSSSPSLTLCWKIIPRQPNACMMRSRPASPGWSLSPRWVGAGECLGPVSWLSPPSRTSSPTVSGGRPSTSLLSCTVRRSGPNGSKPPPGSVRQQSHQEYLASLCYASPKTVTPAITPGTQPLCVLPHSPYHLCYDDLAHEHGVRVPDGEVTRWTLSRSWIR